MQSHCLYMINDLCTCALEHILCETEQVTLIYDRTNELLSAQNALMISTVCAQVWPSKGCRVGQLLT